MAVNSPWPRQRQIDSPFHTAPHPHAPLEITENPLTIATVALEYPPSLQGHFSKFACKPATSLKRLVLVIFGPFRHPLRRALRAGWLTQLCPFPLPFTSSRNPSPRSTPSSARTWRRPSPSLTPSLQSWIRRSGRGLRRWTCRMKTWTSMVSAILGGGRRGWCGVCGVDFPDKGTTLICKSEPGPELTLCLGVLALASPTLGYPLWPLTPCLDKNSFSVGLPW